MQSLETKSSRPRPKSFEIEIETETRPETFETEPPKTGLETRFETETKSRDSITAVDYEMGLLLNLSSKAMITSFQSNYILIM